MMHLKTIALCCLLALPSLAQDANSNTTDTSRTASAAPPIIVQVTTPEWTTPQIVQTAVAVVVGVAVVSFIGYRYCILRRLQNQVQPERQQAQVQVTVDQTGNEAKYAAPASDKRRVKTMAMSMDMPDQTAQKLFDDSQQQPREQPDPLK
jgi:hypothetical protein